MSTKYWIGVASKNHVLIGVKHGFCQLNHGKKQALNRMKNGDYIIYYSPKLSLDGQEPYQKFIAVGQIISETYQGSMSESFHPYRRDVKYFDIINEVSLSEINYEQSWLEVRSKLRFGHLEISLELFNLITQLMGLSISSEGQIE